MSGFIMSTKNAKKQYLIDIGQGFHQLAEKILAILVLKSLSHYQNNNIIFFILVQQMENLPHNFMYYNGHAGKSVLNDVIICNISLFGKKLTAAK